MANQREPHAHTQEGLGRVYTKRLVASGRIQEGQQLRQFSENTKAKAQSACDSHQPRQAFALMARKIRLMQKVVTRCQMHRSGLASSRPRQVRRLPRMRNSLARLATDTEVESCACKCSPNSLRNRPRRCVAGRLLGAICFAKFVLKNFKTHLYPSNPSNQ